MKEKTIEITDQQLNNFIDRHNQNIVEVAGVIVSSQTSSLKEVEETINRLIAKHMDFLIARNKLRMVNYVE